MCPEMDLNHRPIDFQSIASTAELPGHVVERVTPKELGLGWIRIRVQQLRSKLNEPLLLGIRRRSLRRNL